MRNYVLPALAFLMTFAASPVQGDPVPVTLGEAFSFGVLAGSTVTNTGPTVVFGHVGVAEGTAITGFPSGMVVDGVLHSNDAIAQQAQEDLTTAYNVIAGEASNQDLTGQDLGGLTLTPGVYSFSSSAQLTGSLVLDAQGDPNARFDFQIGSTLTTASNSDVIMVNGATSENIFFQVGSSATLGTGTVFTGNILAMDSITLTTGASIPEGRVLARNGAVTLDTNNLGPVMPVIVPEPSTATFLGCVGLPLAFAVLRRRGSRKHEAA
ncbi:MAG: DUF3494 domain-containing protein [Akkermansiaceae bacterium]|nr:DUF3494 domain-containing protein [Armatimonadota bacterium]